MLQCSSILLIIYSLSCHVTWAMSHIVSYDLSSEFDHEPRLKTLRLSQNRLRLLPRSFGAGAWRCVRVPFHVEVLVYSRVHTHPGIMWVKQCQKAPMTGNGKHTTYKNGDLGDWLLSLFYPHSIEYGNAKNKPHWNGKMFESPIVYLLQRMITVYIYNIHILWDCIPPFI